MTRTSFGNGTLNAYTIAPMEIKNKDRFGYKVIAVIHDDQYWCAYRLPTTALDSEWTDFGDAISFAAADALFPTLSSSGRSYYNP